jgi:hypothetical protein
MALTRAVKTKEAKKLQKSGRDPSKTQQTARFLEAPYSFFFFNAKILSAAYTCFS